TRGPDQRPESGPQEVRNAKAALTHGAWRGVVAEGSHARCAEPIRRLPGDQRAARLGRGRGAAGRLAARRLHPAAGLGRQPRRRGTRHWAGGASGGDAKNLASGRLPRARMRESQFTRYGQYGSLQIGASLVLDRFGMGLAPFTAPHVRGDTAVLIRPPPFTAE